MRPGQCRSQRRQVAGDDLPDDIGIDVQVIVDDPMPHADEAMPWNPRHRLAAFGRYVARLLTDRLDTMDE